MGSEMCIRDSFHIVPRWADRPMKGHGHAPMADAEHLKTLAAKIAAELA